MDELVQRFLTKVKKDGECRVWTGGTNDGGYGYMRVPSRFGLPLPEIARAHRIAYILFVGPLEPDVVLDHVCRNRLCVRHDHLRACTVSANSTEANIYRWSGDEAAEQFWEELEDGF